MYLNKSKLKNSSKALGVGDRTLFFRFFYFMKINIILKIFIIFNAMQLIPNCTFAQNNPKDTAINTPLLGFSYAFQFPGGNLKERFGYNSSIGIHFLNKTKKNWIWGLDWTFTFSPQSQVKEPLSLFDSINTSNGNLVDANGEYAVLLFYERGWTSTFKFGKLFPVGSQNKNSGICLLTGLGYMQHKIRIEDKFNRAPQISKEYKKGYDRLSSGLMLSQFVGYMFLGNNKLLNFYAGFEIMAGFTKNRRSFNFDTMEQDTKQRLDLYYGPRIGFILPLYKRLPNDYYYN